MVPGATVTLTDEARGTKLAPATTDATGTYLFPNVTPATYSVEVTMSGFKTAQRKGLPVSGGDRVSVPAITLEIGGQAETVMVTAESPLVQAQSGERSFAVTTEQVENLPIQHGNFISLIQLVPGVKEDGANQDGARIGGAGQNNIMMDGISAMDTGNNGQMLNMNIESIAEVKILTQGYQAEYGRSSGLQITAVTKSGTNRFRGSAYDLVTDSKWNSNRELNILNGDPKPKATSKTLGYSIGGPIGKPGGHNKLFFFYSHEYRPTNNPINSGNPIRLRVPTAAERAGDFSGTLDQNGNLFNSASRDPTTGDLQRNRSERLFRRRRRPRQDPGEPAVCAGPGDPEPLSGGQSDPDRGAELQLRARRHRLRGAPDRETAAPAAGAPSGLSVLAQVAPVLDLWRRPAARADDPRPHSGDDGRALPLPVHHQLRGHGQLHGEPDDVPRGHLRLHPQRAHGRQ